MIFRFKNEIFDKFQAKKLNFFVKNSWFEKKIKINISKQKKLNEAQNMSWKNFYKWVQKKTRNEKKNQKKKIEKWRKNQKFDKKQIFFSISKFVISRIFFSKFNLFQNLPFQKKNARECDCFRIIKRTTDSWNLILIEGSKSVFSWIFSRVVDSRFKMRIWRFLLNKMQNWIVSDKTRCWKMPQIKCDIILMLSFVKCRPGLFHNRGIFYVCNMLDWFFRREKAPWDL